MRQIRLLALLLCILGASGANAQAYRADPQLLKLAGPRFSAAAAQYKVMMATLPPGRFPKTFNPRTGVPETSGPDWWCSGFYPGTLMNLYGQTKDTVLLKEARRMLDLLAPEQYNTGTHDLGFMMFCSFGTAWKISPQPEYRDILLNSAKSLASRFDPKTGCIRSWDSKKEDFLVIIDNMMNLELLFWAARESGDSSYYRIAVTHANTTMKNHFRPDYSSYHVVNYNPETGAVQKRQTAQGFADASAWARGQAWGLYGFTVMYRETHDPKYLQQAQHIAGFILGHPNLPADQIPYWDFNAPDIPLALRDASAAAVMASALLELYRYADAAAAVKYAGAAAAMLNHLSAAPYLAEPGTNGGFILQHSVGHFPQQTEVDQPLTYADYYYVEAMQRYLQLRAVRAKIKPATLTIKQK